MAATWAPVRPIRPWVQRTALGSPVDPDVKISRKRSSSDGAGDLAVDRRRGVEARRRGRGRRPPAPAPAGHGVRGVVEQAGEVGRGHQRLAVGVVDQLGELLAPVGRVDADHDRARQRPGGEPEEVVGHVVEQDADVRRALRVAELGEERRPPPALPDQVAVAPAPVLVEEGGTVVVAHASRSSRPRAVIRSCTGPDLGERLDGIRPVSARR